MKTDIVLVRPKYAFNVGLTCRAMANFGVSQLHIIDSQCELGDKAKDGAAGAQKPLDKKLEYSNWDHFLKESPDGVRLGLSRRKGKDRRVLPLTETLKQLAEEPVNRRLYLVFGPEDHGLSQMDHEHLHRLCELDIPGDFKSLNLSHAALLTLKEVSRHWPPTEIEPDGESLTFPVHVLKKWLETSGHDIQSSKTNSFTILRSMLLRSMPNERELKILSDALNKNIKLLSSD